MKYTTYDLESAIASLPDQLQGLRRQLVAIDKVAGTVRRVSIKGNAYAPTRCVFALWTTDETGIVEWIQAKCAYCGEQLDAGKARNWRAKHLHGSMVKPMYCDRECRTRHNQKPPKHKRTDMHHYLKTAFEGGDL